MNITPLEMIERAADCHLSMRGDANLPSRDYYTLCAESLASSDDASMRLLSLEYEQQAIFLLTRTGHKLPSPERLRAVG